MKTAVCPYCEARFLYPDVKKRMKHSTGDCPHCGGRYRVARGGTAVYLVVAFAVLIAMNLGLLSIGSMNLAFLLIATVLGVTVFYLLLPFSVRFRKDGAAPAPAGKAAKKAKGRAKS